MLFNPIPLSTRVAFMRARDSTNEPSDVLELVISQLCDGLVPSLFYRGQADGLRMMRESCGRMVDEDEAQPRQSRLSSLRRKSRDAVLPLRLRKSSVVAPAPPPAKTLAMTPVPEW